MRRDLDFTIDNGKLFDIYKALLTDKQKETLELYFDEDLTYSEIAEQLSISKQAVSDKINKGIRVLKTYENALGFAAYRDGILGALEKAKRDSTIQIKDLIEEIENIDLNISVRSE